MRSWAYTLIVDRIMREEYVIARKLGYTAVDAMLHAMTIRDDFRRMCECMSARTDK